MPGISVTRGVREKARIHFFARPLHIVRGAHGITEPVSSATRARLQCLRHAVQREDRRENGLAKGPNHEAVQRHSSTDCRHDHLPHDVASLPLRRRQQGGHVQASMPSAKGIPQDAAAAATTFSGPLTGDARPGAGRAVGPEDAGSLSTSRTGMDGNGGITHFDRMHRGRAKALSASFLPSDA